MKIRIFSTLLVAMFFCTVTSAHALYKAGETAPDFNARTLDDKTLKLSDLKGKTLLVKMGTTWCPACTELAHQIEGLRTDLKKNDISFVAVYLGDSAKSIRSHTKDEKLTPADFTIIDSGEARRNYSIFSIPRLLLIDKNFKIVFDKMVLSGKQIKQQIEEHRRTE